MAKRSGFSLADVAVRPVRDATRRRARVANLASRALSLSLRRLSDDMQSRYGFMVQPSDVAGGDLRRPVALCRRLLPGVELAGVGGDAGLRALGGRLGGWLGGARRAEADLGVPADRRCVGRVAASGRPASPGLRQPVGEVPSEKRLRSLFGHPGKARPAGNGCCLFPLSQTPAPFACQDIDCGLFLVILLSGFLLSQESRQPSPDIPAKDSFPALIRGRNPPI